MTYRQLRYRKGSSALGLLADYDVMPGSRQRSVLSTTTALPPETNSAAAVSQIAVPNIVPAADQSESQLPVEVGGRDGPEPTRFGDWERAGRCIDF
jgi:hypothetical protein